jgi:hypothetical protein
LDDSLQNTLYVLGAILFWLGPMILRFLKKRKQKAAYSAPTKSSVEPAARARKPVPTPRDPLVLSEQSTGQGQLDNMLDRARIARDRAYSLVGTCHSNEASVDLVGLINARCSGPLDEIIIRLEQRSPDDAMMSSGLSVMSGEIGSIERRVGLLEVVVDRRIVFGKADILRAFDGFVQDCLGPYILHARRMDLSVSTLIPYIVPRSQTDQNEATVPTSDLLALEVFEGQLNRPGSWSVTARSAAWSFFRASRTLNQRISFDLKLPDVRSSVANFYSTGRLTLPTLVSGWFEDILADVCAAIQMGPSYAAGLAQVREFGAMDTGDTTATIDEHLRFGPMPLHLRMYVACLALKQLGFEEEAEGRWEDWNESQSQPDAITLATSRFPEMPLPADRIFGAIDPVIIGLLSRSFSALGGYGIAQIPDLLCTPQLAGNMERLSGELIHGKSSDDPPRVVFGAVPLAMEKGSTRENIIKRAAVDAVLEKGMSATAHKPASVPVGDRMDLVRVLSSVESIARAVAVSATLSPQRGGRGLR